MVEGSDNIREIVHNYAASAALVFPIKKVILFGSWAKGEPHKNSDIDVAVIVDCDDHSRRLEIASGLFHCTVDVDTRIEPKCVFWDEFQNPEPCSILEEIIRTGIEVV